MSEPEHPEVGAAAERPAGLISLLAQELQGEIEPVYFAEPPLLLSARPAIEQVGLELVETGQHLRVDLQHRAPDAGVLVRARSAVGAGASAEFDLAFVEVLLELGPLLVGGRPVLLGEA
jgi:hypothetical protein